MNAMIDTRTGGVCRGLAAGLVVCLATTLANVPAHAYDLLVTSDTVDTDSLYRYHARSGKLKKTIDLAVAAQNPDGQIAPFGVYVGPRRTVYVTSRSDDSILRLTRKGGVRVLVEPGSGGLNDPFYIIERDGLLYVSSRLTNEIKRYDAETGAYVDNFVEAGLGGLNGPRGLRFGPDSNLYVNSSVGNEVIVFDGETGAFVEVFLEMNEVRTPCGLAFHRHGRMWNMCLGSAAFDPEDPDHAGGVICYDWASRTRIARIQEKQTCGVDFGPEGKLYIVFAGSQRVGVYSLRRDRLKILDDTPSPKALAVWLRSRDH